MPSSTDLQALWLSANSLEMHQLTSIKRRSMRTSRARASSMQSWSHSNRTLQAVNGEGRIPSSSASTGHSLHSTSLAATYVFQSPNLSQTRCAVSSAKSSGTVGNTAKPKRKSVHAVARVDTIIPCGKRQNIVSIVKVITLHHLKHALSGNLNKKYSRSEASKTSHSSMLAN